MQEINFDYQAGSTLAPEILESVRPFLHTVHHPGSLHRRGLKARAALETARMQIARLIGATRPEEIFFVDSGAEALQRAFRALRLCIKSGDQIILSAVESATVQTEARSWPGTGGEPVQIPVDRQGRINPGHLRLAWTNYTRVALVQWANPELGTIQPMPEIAALGQEWQIPLISDASAAGGSVAINVQDSPVKALFFDSARLGGPQGPWALYLRGETSSSLVDVMPTDWQSHNLPGIVGFGEAARMLREQREIRTAHHQQCQTVIWQTLSTQVENIYLLGPLPGPGRMAHHLTLAAPGAEGEALALKLDLQGCMVASSPVCLVKPERHSPVLQAAGIPHEMGRSLIILTLGGTYTTAELERFCQVYRKSVGQLRAMQS